ncbi:Long-chain-fatty-acid--CoA ligase [Actinokineospora spheciospongiae]|uniref:Long-chain-fatty-acid--CoA ligase n=1 Tax=Actinokineospora spheciospongiae TaxID=909613 RepID=W7JB87_9PSEU|nr:AMP-binding protein [Actinokineospora spheciospongiae]EWC63324.1 Long-chain-fatty-acid--CoA ligase [Actinokineospora spheciospongiae]
MPGPDLTLDAVLAATARAHPDRVALRADYGDLTYAELDEAVTACAHALRGLLGSRRAVVAVASPLHPDFAVAFYGVIRAGHTVAPINPLMPAHLLEHALISSDARLAFVTTDLFAQLRRVRTRPPNLLEATLVGPGGREDAGDIRTLDDLVAAHQVLGARAAPAPPVDPGALACVHFTSGTTGLPKGVLLSHRNLTVNAAQVAAAHGLHSGSTVLNQLPKFHLMHLNAAVHAGATQVLCADADPKAGIDLANRSRCSHLYTIPVRLTRLAADPALPGLRLDTVAMIASGGSALSPVVAERLSAHFGVPVLQGYGLAETSPLTHSASAADPGPGSVGPPVPGTACRVVDLSTRRVLPTGERGEVQVRGPQVMLGYLDPDEPTGIDEHGWLSTGDIGYVDPAGRLHLVDRIKDLFKCDNYLVSPAEVESVLERHPAVRDCAVVAYPDSESGEVPTAFVVPAAGAADAADPTASTIGVAEAVAAFVAERVPHYQRLRHVELVTAIPRSPVGKVNRRDLRAELITRRALGARVPGNTDERRTGMADDGKDLSNLITVIARFSTAGDPLEFERFFLEHVEYMRGQDGFGAHQAVRLADDPSVYVNFGWWLDQEAFQKVVQSPEFRDHQGVMQSMLRKADLDLCKNLFRVNAAESAGERAEFGTPLMTITTYRGTGSAEEFDAAFTAFATHIREIRGFGYADLNRSLRDAGTCTGLEYWWDPAAREVAVSGPEHARLASTAEITVERVTHVAWNRAPADEETPTAAGRQG